MLDAQIVSDMISLVLEDYPSEQTVEKWTEEQRQRAWDWAQREYLGASDNDVLSLSKPDFIK